MFPPLQLLPLILTVLALRAISGQAFKPPQSTPCVENAIFTAINSQSDYFQAEAACLELDGSHLASINSQQEFDRVTELIEQAEFFAFAYWIGLRDKSTTTSAPGTERFTFEDNSVEGLSLFHVEKGQIPWGNNQPDSTSQKCVKMVDNIDFFGPGFRLDDDTCTRAVFSFICKTSCSSPTTSPSTSPSISPTFAPTASPTNKTTSISPEEVVLATVTGLNVIALVCVGLFLFVEWKSLQLLKKKLKKMDEEDKLNAQMKQ